MLICDAWRGSTAQAACAPQEGTNSSEESRVSWVIRFGAGQGCNQKSALTVIRPAACVAASVDCALHETIK